MRIAALLLHANACGHHLTGTEMIERILLIAGLSVFTLAGCVIHVDTSDDEEDWATVQRANERTIRSLELERGIDSVRAEMGKPDFIEAFSRQGDEFTVLFYRTHRTKGDGRTTKDETTPLVFVNGKLVGWGEAAIEHATGN